MCWLRFGGEVVGPREDPPPQLFHSLLPYYLKPQSGCWARHSRNPVIGPKYTSMYGKNTDARTVFTTHYLPIAKRAGIVEEKQKAGLFVGRSLNCNSGCTHKYRSLLTSTVQSTQKHILCGTSWHLSLGNDWDKRSFRWGRLGEAPRQLRSGGIRVSWHHLIGLSAAT